MKDTKRKLTKDINKFGKKLRAAILKHNPNAECFGPDDHDDLTFLITTWLEMHLEGDHILDTKQEQKVQKIITTLRRTQSMSGVSKNEFKKAMKQLTKLYPHLWY